MVKKLWKHEFLSYVRLLIPVYAAVFGVAALNRLLQFFEADTVVYKLAFGSSTVLCVLAMLIAGLLTTIFIVLRFYRHLFTGEGYLTFTLPATPTQHLWVKLTCACVCQWMTYAVIILSAMLLGAGDMTYEVFKAAAYLFDLAYNAIGFHTVLFVIEFIAAVFVAGVSGVLLYYSCIAIGQTFKKNRVLAAVGVYFVYNVITQIISTVTSIVFTLSVNFLPMDELTQWVEQNPCAFVHIMMITGLVMSAALSTVFFLLTRSILYNKLNLE